MTMGVSFAAALVAVSWIGTLGSDPSGTLHAGQSLGVGQRQNAPAGNVAAGKDRWNEQECAFCHGLHAQGGYGPDLAGLGLTFEQFKHQIRQPWGAMPRWSEQQLPDNELANLYAYFTSLPRVERPGVVPPGFPPDVPSRRLGANNIGLPARITAPPNAPLGQRYSINTAGCAQCHGAEHKDQRLLFGSRVDHKFPEGRDLNQQVRATLGFTGEDKDVDYEFFKACVYDHEKVIPQARMGTYSRARLPEPIVREIYNFVMSLGPLPRVDARLTPGVRSGDTVSYTVTVENEGTPQGVKPEDVSVELVLAPDVTVVSARGEGYQGIHRDPRSDRDVAVWKVPTIAGKEEQTFTVVVTGPGANNAIATMPREEQWSSTSALVIPGRHSRVYWAKPTTRELPNMVKEPRRPPVGDDVAIRPVMNPQPRPSA
jgi:uncharacterized repeat protein (TIGR01451 family)